MSEYKISRRIGRGGMAEVFLAMQEGIGGFEKLVVLKRIFRHFCEDEKFVHMFLTEARLAASISHPNVVEILDIQQDADGFFIIMEYLSGETLAFLLDEMKASCERIPIPIVCRIVADVAAGLHYAHSHTDLDGEIQAIVHRDVTPSNLLICYSGITKIVDFGVAKAMGDPDHSVPGSLKGKLAYLAPEQIRSEQIGPRTDVFQLGVVMHEMLTGRHLFQGENDHFIMNAVLENDIPPPSKFNPDVTPALDAVVLAALTRNPDERTESADAMRRAIAQVISESGEKASQHDVADWIRTTFAERLRGRQKLERECTSEMRAGRPSSEMPALGAPFAPTAPVTYDSDHGDTPTVAARPSTQTSAVRAPTSRRRGAVGAAVLALAVVGALVVWWRSGSANGSGGAKPTPPSPTPPVVALAPPDAVAAPLIPAAQAPDALATNPKPRFHVSISVEPEAAEIEFDGANVGSGEFSAVLPQDGKTHRLRVSAPGYRTRIILFTDNTPPGRVVLERLPRTSTDAAPTRKSTPVTSGTRPSGVQSTPGGTDGTAPKNPGTTPAPTRPSGPTNPGATGTDNIDPWAKGKG